MREIINTVLKRNCPIYVNRRCIESFLTFESIEFMDDKNRHCQLFIGYNSSNVYCVHKNLLCSKKGPIVDVINSAITRWDTREEFLKNKITLANKEIFDEVGRLFQQNIIDSIIHISYEEYSCRKVIVTTTPVATILIHYNKSKRRQLTLKAFLGDTLYLKYIDTNFKVFVEKCLSKYCEIVWIN